MTNYDRLWKNFASSREDITHVADVRARERIQPNRNNMTVKNRLYLRPLRVPFLKREIEKAVTNYKLVLRIVVSFKKKVLGYKIKYVEKVTKDSRLVRAVFELN